MGKIYEYISGQQPERFTHIDSDVGGVLPLYSLHTHTPISTGERKHNN